MYKLCDFLLTYRQLFTAGGNKKFVASVLLLKLHEY